MLQNPPDLIIEPIVRHALDEDLGSFGDITTSIVIPPSTNAYARICSREAGVISGVQVAKIAFQLVDPTLEVISLITDGDKVDRGMSVMEIKGSAASILMAERVALNFAGRLSGIASLTALFVAQTKGTSARITCTRKTTPGLRMVEKLAVVHGGGFNHRFSLSDAILIKDNHIATAKGVRQVLRAIKNHASHMMRVEIEVDTLEQFSEVLDEGGADVVLLDNMTLPMLQEAVNMNAGRLILEASGNMRLDRIAEVAATGVNYISVGALTHSAPTLDLGLDF